MAGEFSDVGAGYALDIVTGRNAGPGARTTYLALLTAAPSDTTTLATMSEVSTSGYARQAVTWSAPALDTGVMTTKNSAQLTFGPFTADPPNITHCALVSASSGTTGDFLAWWSLTAAKDPAINESLQFAATTGLTLAAD
jgi:hypothetical protein